MFPEEVDNSSSTRTTIAIILMLLAAVLTGWVVATIYSTVAKDDKPALVEKLMPEKGHPVKLTTPAGDFLLPDEMFVVTAYLVLFLLLSVAATIGVKFLNAGVNLLRPDSDKATRRLLREIGRVSSTAQQTG